MAFRNIPIDKYLKVKEFAELCSEMRVYLGRNPEALLEAYEEHGLIRPIFRLNIPDDYIKLLFSYNHVQQNEKSPISLPEEHADIHDFLQDRLMNYHVTYSPWINRTLKEGHPLDWAYRENKTYIQKPSQETFKPWKEFETVKGILYNKFPQRGRTAEHYYAHWQVFLFEEANSLFSITINQFLPPYSPDISVKKTSLSLTHWTKEFEILAEYRFKKQLLFENYMSQTSNNILDGVLLDEYSSNIGQQAKLVFNRVSEGRWVEFLRKLCEYYFLYEEKEKIKLSKFLRDHMYSAVEIFLKVSKLPYSQLVNKVGKVIGGKEYFYWLPLEKILPDEEKEKRREAEHYLHSLRDKYIIVMPGQAIDDSDICGIIEEAITQGNDTLLTKIIEIEKELWEDSIFRFEKIWSHIRSLATAVETYGSDIFPNTSSLYNSINKSLNGKYECLKKPFDDFLRKSITDAKNPTEFLKNINLLVNTPTTINIPNNLVNLKFLLLANVTRNFVIHSSILDGQLFGKHFLEIYKSLVFSIFYLFKNKNRPQP